MTERRPSGPHRYGQCRCASRLETADRRGRLESATTEERDAVIGMFTRNSNANSFIPHPYGSYRSPDVIYHQSENELYNYCQMHGFCRLWPYCWIIWYRPTQWKLRAMSACETEIPVLKTTIIVVPHWRVVKHDYLHRFNRPRVDLVAWILSSRMIPRSVKTMHAILDKYTRKARSSWRKLFKPKWKKLGNHAVSPEKLWHYHTDPHLWSCTCPSFLLGRFNICKHVVSCWEPMS